MKIITWNLNSRTNKKNLQKQCKYLEDGNFDIITLQEVLVNSQSFFKDYFRDLFIMSSFDLVEDKSVLVKNRKFGQLIISKKPIEKIEKCLEIPFPERVLSGLVDGCEIHTTHVPPGSSNGVIKVEHFEGLYSFLSKRKRRKKIVTGDFNSPKQELENGEVITWGQKINSNGKIRIAVNPKWKDQCTGKRWDLAERNVIQNHFNLGLKDVFRTLRGYESDSSSWFTNKGVGRRYDHIFCSKNFEINDVFYDQEPRLEKTSDHSPLIAEIKLKGEKRGL